MFENSQAFFKYFKQLKLACKLDEWKEKVSQGRIARANNIDTASHRTCLTSILATVWSFVWEARLQILEYAHTNYPGTYAKSHSRCDLYSDTISHALNGCRESKNSIQKRHNRLAYNYSRAKCERPIFLCDDLGRPDCPAVIL